MKVNIIVTSTNELTNIKAFKPTLGKHDYKVIVIDEGDEKLREKNEGLLSEISHVYYGPRERGEWFKHRFGSSYEKYLSAIPERCHAETSFGFLLAYEEKVDLVIELDDDVFPVQGHDLVDCHIKNLFNEDGVTVYSDGKWYNTMENLELNVGSCIFPRGHPYAQEARLEKYDWEDKGGECILNLGLWAGNPDLDALTILYHGGLDGRCDIEGRKCKREKVIVENRTYFALCSMNASFLPKVIPAFYQLYMGFMGVDRFDDVWSGVLLKKIADHLGDRICLGEPLIYHAKRPRDTFKDLKSEMDGIVINENLWRLVDSVELDGKTYWDCYSSLSKELKGSVPKLPNAMQQKFMLAQLKKMKLWLEVVDRLM